MKFYAFAEMFSQLLLVNVIFFEVMFLLIYSIVLASNGVLPDSS